MFWLPLVSSKARFPEFVGPPLSFSSTLLCVDIIKTLAPSRIEVLGSLVPYIIYQQVNSLLVNPLV